MSSLFYYFSLLSKCIFPLLAALACICIIITIERWIFFRRCNTNILVFMEGISRLICVDRYNEAIDLCERDGSPAANIIRCGIQNKHLSPQEIKSHIKSAALLEVPRCERRIHLLSGIAHIAPLIGLIGVIFSFFLAFHSLQLSGITYHNSAVFTDAVMYSASAIVCSICLGIMTHICYYLLYSKLKHTVYQMEWAYNEILQLIINKKHTSSCH